MVVRVDLLQQNTYFTVREICELLGISKSNLYYHLGQMTIGR
ncbi:helix-turn-helix transcriptional regulator [Candidatus Saccharibacteria bacterium]|nr:helix-turn-helix transcriptional regulator [Candidatus Saccharibacteria bacterium]